MLQVSLNKRNGTCHNLFGLLQWTGVPRSSPVRGVSPALPSTRFCSAAPPRASEQEPLSEAQVTELSCCSKVLTMLSMQVPRVRGNYMVRQVEPPYLVRLNYLWEVAWYPRGRRLRQTHPLPFIPLARHSHHRIGDCLLCSA